MKIESGLGYKFSQFQVQVLSVQVRVQIHVQQTGLKSGLESKSGLEYCKSVYYYYYYY